MSFAVGASKSSRNAAASGSAPTEARAPGARASTKSDQVETAIRGFLASGELSPGEKISLRKLAATLGVSMMPVRNAVSRLQSDGVLEVEPGRAVRVPVLTRDQFRELLAIRMEIEGYAAEQAAANRTEEDLKSIEGLNASFQILGVGPSTRSSGAARVNMEFHFAVYRASKMPTLVDIIERLWLKAGPVVFYHIYLEKFSSPSRDSVRLHRQAIDALRARDGAAARSAIAKDLLLAGNRLLEENIFRGP